MLFSITGANLAGWLFAALLGLVFTAGMVATDALNGLWVSHMVRRPTPRRGRLAHHEPRHRARSALAIAALGAASSRIRASMRRSSHGALCTRASRCWSSRRWHRRAAVSMPSAHRKRYLHGREEAASRAQRACPRSPTRSACSPAFSGAENELGISALASRLGLAKSTVHRLAATLVEHGILEQNRETGKYRLGLALFELGALVRRTWTSPTRRAPQMRELLEKTGETVQLGIVDHSSVLYIYEMESRQRDAHGGRGGRARAAALHGVGKVLLAFQPPDDVKQVDRQRAQALHRQHHHRARGARSRMLAASARARLRDRRRGERDRACAASPRRCATTRGAVIAALGVAAPVQRMTKKVMQNCVPIVVATASAVSRRLGYLPAHAAAEALEHA